MTMTLLSADQLDLLEAMTSRDLNGWSLFPDWFIEPRPRKGFRRLLRPQIDADRLPDLRRLYDLAKTELQEKGNPGLPAVLLNVIVCTHLFPEFWPDGGQTIHAQWRTAANAASLDPFDPRMFAPVATCPVGIICRRASTNDIMRLVFKNEDADYFIAAQRKFLAERPAPAPLCGP